MSFFDFIQLDKLISMVFALGIIQLLGGLASRWMDARAGFIISGFVNGLVSSTAFTAALARKSNELTEEQVKIESVSFLSATLAMLAQGMFLVAVGLAGSNPSVLHIFLGPIAMTLILIIIRVQKNKSIKASFPKKSLLDVLSLIKLTIFIVGIITISKLLQMQFGGLGLEVLTFFVSLFEIHGSMIANTQFYVKESIASNEFSFLLAISIFSSYLGKLVIVLILGSPYLKKRLIIWTSFLLLSIVVNLYLL